MQWDYIVVGAGSAGCVLANRLSADGKSNVLLLEAGGTDRNPLQRVPILGSFLNYCHPKRDWRYMTSPDPSRNNRTECWPRGKILGGSSSVNGMIYVRGHRDDFDHWAQLGNSGWSYEDVLPHFRNIENHEFEDSDYYGNDGDLGVKQIKGEHFLSTAFVDACKQQGIVTNPHYNAEQQEGAAVLCVTQSKRFRQSSSQAFLQPARHRRNLKIMTNALVTRILFDGKKAVGVEVSCNGEKVTEKAHREIILSGGSINSPQLLMLSGVGPAQHLNNMGIEVVHDLPGVGQNLQEHPCIPMQARMKVKTVNQQLNNPLSIVRHGFDWLVSGKGPLTSVAFQALAFAKTDPALSYPDVQIHFAPMGFTGDENGIYLLDYPAITLQPNVNRSRSRGELRLRTNSPFDPPDIQPNLLGDEYDRSVLIESGKLSRRIIKSEAFAAYLDHETLPGPEVTTNDEWESYIREMTGPVYHPVGTCKMGVDAMAVVNPDLCVHGIDNLRIADGSIFPAIVSGNTNAACLMIGEKGAAKILGRDIPATEQS
ncbi:MAG: hypothetical protein GXP16_08070 [Gammaproteobacteria bacterium]|nr:hypothetical protein [Gammaproteobacteria bacterium]